MKSIEQIKAEREQLLEQLDVREQELREARREQHRKLREEQAKIEEEHRAKVAEEYEIPRGEWFDRAYAIAWKYGHSSGFSEVKGYFSEIAELYKIDRR